jgi:hypothetical protein
MIFIRRDGDPVEIMVEVRRRYDKLVQEAILEKTAKLKADPSDKL